MSERLRSTVAHMARFIEDQFMRPSCVVCGEGATGKGPGNNPMCYEHATEAWDDVQRIR